MASSALDQRADARNKKAKAQIDIEGNGPLEHSGSDSNSPAFPDPQNSPNAEQNPSLTFRQRVKHWTWPWFTLTMATGGIASVIYNGKLLSLVRRGTLHFLRRD